MVDRTLVLRKIADLDQYLAQIQDYAATTVEQYAQDWKTQRIVERTLQMMVETCLDIAGHVIADQQLRVPDNYADSFKVLNENEIIGDRLLKPMVEMARFRNIIVHHYDKIDPPIVVNILRKHLKDFTRFKNAILEHLG